MTGTASSSDSNDYTSAIYFLYLTATTIGYGGVNTYLSQGTGLVYFSAIVLISLGLVFDAYIQSRIRQTVQEINRLSNYYLIEMEDLEDWIALRNMATGAMVPKKYEDTLREFYSRQLNVDVHTTLKMKNFLNLISDEHRTEIVFRATFRYIKCWREFFKHVNVEIAIQVLAVCESKL